MTDTTAQMRVKGTILSAPRATGVILGDDGDRYAFDMIGWIPDDVRPDTGIRVDFEPRGSHAVDINPIAWGVGIPVTSPDDPADLRFGETKTPLGVASDQADTSSQVMKTIFADRWFWALFGLAVGVLLGISLAAVLLNMWAETEPDNTTDYRPFAMDWRLSASEVTIEDSFELTLRMHSVERFGEHGGISVSFPSLTDPGGSNDGYSSPLAEVEVVSYATGLDKVTFHQPGQTIYHREGNRQFPAEHLLVEADDASWPEAEDRTLVIGITPKIAGDFEVLVRGWLCADGYTVCTRNPGTSPVSDQQGWAAQRIVVQVKPSP